jgi:NAD(P)-dependent dehydrogenase (short-subunit alcohol dehydrogenase family)
LIDSAEDKFGCIHGLVNYAGITPIASLIDCDENTYDEVMDINIKSAFFCAQYAINNMIKNEGGSIVLVGSAHSWSGQKDRAPYAISKGALYTLFEHISHNYAQDNIRCNYVTMGWTPTEGEVALREKNGMSKNQLLELGASILPMGRLLTPDDHIPAFIYLLSDDSSMVTGSNIRVTAGEYI